MNCNACTKARPLNHCSDSISIGTFAIDTDYYVYLKQISNGSITRFEATSDGAGLLEITTTGVEFATTSDYELWVTLESATNQYDRVLFDVSNGAIVIEDIACLLLTFEKVVDAENCCVCLADQTILLEAEIIQPTSPCVCVTQADVDNWNAAVPAYKSYVALLTQTGTNDPVATVLQNELGGTVVWTYDSLGNYNGTLAGAFPAGKVWAIIVNNAFISTVAGMFIARATDDFVQITNGQWQIQGVNPNDPIQCANVDGVLDTTPIEIRVYP